MRTPGQREGDTAETFVADRLGGSGWEVLGRQVHVGRSELDLVAIDPGPPPTLVIVEVRWRGRRDFGLPEETIDWRKRASVRRGGFELRERAVLPDGRPLPRLPLRFDLVVVEPSRAIGGRGDRPGPIVRHHRGGC